MAGTVTTHATAAPMEHERAKITETMALWTNMLIRVPPVIIDHRPRTLIIMMH
jgi:hypothetical protein